MKINCVVLSWSKTERERAMTEACIRSLWASAGGNELRIAVVETKPRQAGDTGLIIEQDVFAPPLITVYPNRPFAYNSFVKEGLLALPADADAILVSNNDVVYRPGCVERMASAVAAHVETGHAWDSVSPWNPYTGWHERLFHAVKSGLEVAILGYRTGHELCGWSILTRREVFDTIGMDALLPDELEGWYQDDFYGEQLRRHGFKHALIRDAEADHLCSQSLRLLSREEGERLTSGQRAAFDAFMAGPTGPTGSAGTATHATGPVWPTGTRLSIIIPTIGRESLRRTLESLGPAGFDPSRDEVIVVADGRQQAVFGILADFPFARHLISEPDHATGYPQRQLGMESAGGTHVLFMDDDDTYRVSALNAIRHNIAMHPDRVLVFRADFTHRATPQGPLVWKTPELVVGNVCMQAMCFPHQPGKMSRFGRRYAADFDFLVDECKRRGEEPVFCDAVVCDVNPPEREAEFETAFPVNPGIRRIVVTDREGAKKIPSDANTAFVSITEPGFPEADIGTFYRIHRTSFFDYGRTWPNKSELMTAEPAEAIWRFVDSLPANVHTLVVHCEMGLSRSPSVAMAILGEHWDAELDWQTGPAEYKNAPRMNRVCGDGWPPNMHVYGMMTGVRGVMNFVKAAKNPPRNPSLMPTGVDGPCGYSTGGLLTTEQCIELAGKMGWSRPGPRRKIAVYTCAKNESKHAERWAGAASDADYRVILDTGSTDDTVAKFRSLGVTVHEARIVPWRFDVARNAALALVPADADICFSVDADEVLMPGWRAAIESAWVEGTTQANYICHHMIDDKGNRVGSFIRNNVHARDGFAWRNPIHEYVEPIDPAQARVVFAAGVETEHRPDGAKPRTQYLPMLERAVADDPSPANLFNLAREYVSYGFADKAIEASTRFLAVGADEGDIRRSAAMRWLANAFHWKKDLVEEERWLLRACAEAPKLREPWVTWGVHCAGRGLHEQAVAAYKRALTITQKAIHHLTASWAWGDYVTHKLAESQDHLKSA